jgi:hypothetical protein
MLEDVQLGSTLFKIFIQHQTRKSTNTMNDVGILYLKFKVSNQKAKFVPREREIYHRITPYVIVFDVAVI